MVRGIQEVLKICGKDVNVIEATYEKNTHQNAYLQNAYNKHGEDMFVMSILELTNDLSIREQYWIDLLNPEYNLTKEVIRNTLSKDSRLKQSITRKKRIKSGEIKLVGREVYCYNLKGEYLFKFSRVTEASKTLNIHPSTIIRNASGKTKQARGYQFRYTFVELLSGIRKYNPLQGEKQQKAVRVTGEGLDLMFKSYRDCAKYFGVTPICISTFINKSKCKIYRGKYKIDLIKQDELSRKSDGITCSQADSTLSEGSTTTGEVKPS